MKINKITEQHHYPGWLRRFPRLIHLHYFILQFLFLRSRVCRRKLCEILENHKSKNTHILDAGCGEGQYLIPLAHKFGEMNFTGIDQNPTHIKFLTKLSYLQHIENCTFYQKDISAHLCEGVSYNLIYIIGVLQYTSDPGTIIRTCAMVQPNSGQLLIYTPVQTRYHFGFYQRIRSRYGHYDDVWDQYRPIEEAELEDWIVEAGYRIIHQEYHYNFAGTLGHEIMQALMILITHWPGLLKVIPCLFFILLIPIFVPLQVVDSVFRSRNRKWGNGLLLILQK